MEDDLNETTDSETFALGIDIGTTSIKVSLLRKSTRNFVESVRLETRASVSDKERNFAEQDVGKILSELEHALSQLSPQFLAKISRIGICGQMHGCVMWKGQSCLGWATFDDYMVTANNVSNLVTWEDGRCTRDFLLTLPSTQQKIAISTGFGCATLFWLQRNQPSLLEGYDCAGTIMDFVVCMLCGIMDKPSMSSQNAVSWGYFDAENMTWELDLLRSTNFPTHLLPGVTTPGTIAGNLQKSFFGIPVGTPVGVALGDFQCSVLSSTSQLCDAVFNIGTACQLAVVIPDDVCHKKMALPHHSAATDIQNNALQILPFFKGTKIITAASLSGGNTLASFIDTLVSWMKDLGLNSSLPPTDQIYQTILDCADRKGSTSLRVIPTLWGERHTPDKRGQVSNVMSDNVSLGDVALALCRGLVENLEQMMSKEFLRLCGVQRIVGTGSALSRNQVLQKQVEQVFGLPLELNDGSDASVGAALAVISG